MRELAARVGVLALGIVAYVLFLVSALYAIAFLAGGPVPTTVDGPAAPPALLAVVVDTGLLALFGLQHSVMARARFKGWWTSFVPAAIERSTYVLASSLVLLLFSQWQPVPAVVWDVERPAARVAVWIGYGFGWAVVLGSTFLIDHFDLVGLRQIYLRVRRRSYRPPGFRTPLLYAMVRHPLMSGFLFVFWVTPTMTVGHLLFAAAMTVYILVGTHFEERDLRAHFPEYVRYAAVTPRFVPRLRRRRAPSL